MLKALPDHCWQSVQWQAYTSSGNVVTSNRIASQGHPPVNGNAGRFILVIALLPETRISQSENITATSLASNGARISLRAKSRRAALLFLMSLYPRKRTLIGISSMSALCQYRTHAPQQTVFLFDYLVGAGEQRLRDAET
jgi:hypothetical protein